MNSRVVLLAILFFCMPLSEVLSDHVYYCCFSKRDIGNVFDRTGYDRSIWESSQPYHVSRSPDGSFIYFQLYGDEVVYILDESGGVSELLVPDNAWKVVLNSKKEIDVIVLESGHVLDCSNEKIYGEEGYRYLRNVDGGRYLLFRNAGGAEQGQGELLVVDRVNGRQGCFYWGYYLCDVVEINDSVYLVGQVSSKQFFRQEVLSIDDDTVVLGDPEYVQINADVVDDVQYGYAGYYTDQNILFLHVGPHKGLFSKNEIFCYDFDSKGIELIQVKTKKISYAFVLKGIYIGDGFQLN